MNIHILMATDMDTVKKELILMFLGFLVYFMDMELMLLNLFMPVCMALDMGLSKLGVRVM